MGLFRPLVIDFAINLYSAKAERRQRRKIRRGNASIFCTVWAPVFISVSYSLGSHIWSRWNLGTENSRHSSVVTRGNQLHNSQDREPQRTHKCVVHGNILRVKRILKCAITPCNQLNVNRRFGGTCRLNLSGLKIEPSKKPA